MRPALARIFFLIRAEGVPGPGPADGTRSQHYAPRPVASRDHPLRSGCGYVPWWRLVA
jgi:hypothetical protein